MTDQWEEQLRCPKCGQAGMASFSQFEEARTPIVDSISDGFMAVQTEYGPDLHCGNCNVPAAP